jgi:hypothetical protein
MDDDVKKILAKQGNKLSGAGRLAFDLLCGDHETAGRVLAEDVARRVGRNDLAREIAASGHPSHKSSPQPRQPPSNVIDGEFEENNDHE